MQEKMVTVSGCLKGWPDWELTDATLAGQKDKTTYKLEGISGARLSLFVGKRVEATGAVKDEGKPASGKSFPGSKRRLFRKPPAAVHNFGGLQ